MANDFLEYKDLYIQTSRENIRQLNDSLLVLEKHPTDPEAIAAIFRATHSLKGESAAMEYTQTAHLCHVVEDAFDQIKKGQAAVTPDLADVLFRCIDAITASIDAVEKTGQESPDLAPITTEVKKLTGVQTPSASHAKQPVAPTPLPAKAAPEPETAGIKTIPVHITQLDTMMDLIEELVIDRLALKQLTQELNNKRLHSYYEKTGRTSAALQYLVMKIRAVPIKMVFDHFPRTVRDLGRILQKDIELVMKGEDLELDRTLVERLDEPLTHLVRNAADHGLGASGTITISAKREQDAAIVEVTDNGHGIDWQALAAKAKVQNATQQELEEILFSGLSTSERVTEISGRGVGLGTVKKTIEEFGGSIKAESQAGKGTTFRIKLPLTLSVMQALVVRVADQHYCIPAPLIDRTVRVSQTQRRQIAGQDILILDGADVPLITLTTVFALQAAQPQPDTVTVVIVTAGNERVGLIVDAIVEANQIIVKPVPGILKSNRAFGGTTILGNGKSALLLNPLGLMP